MTAGAAPGSIIAAIIASHSAANDPNEPSSVATPMSIPVICQTATTQQPAASPSVAATTVAVTVVVCLGFAAVPASTAPSSSGFRRTRR